ncbi:MAG: DUF5597 domain-containing protein [Prevotellaceae bacterium]|nr:DUF5597 domain-containing protein [Prevotellaceae bacterium]
MKRLITLILLCSLAALTAGAQQSRLERQGTATRFVVDGKPFLVLGGELGNSSAACEEDIAQIFPKLERMGLNTVLVPAYWDLLEPEEGQFDFTLTDAVLEQARSHNLKVIFLWFGAWKNSMSCYAPLWFKADYKKYPRAYTKEGKPLEIASAFSDAVCQADKKAFSTWLKHIAEADREVGTVIMIQIENEIGMLEDARDYSPVADKAFQADVPAELVDYLTKHKKELHPQMLDKWQDNGGKVKGNWQELFGADLYTDEIFMAWHYAKYVEQLAQAARAIYDIPLYVNAAMDSRGRKPGEYPSAGPLAHLIDVWHCGAPSIDVLAPDLYDNGFTEWVAKYHLPGNPLFIPEIRLTDNDGVRAFYVFGEHDAMGFSPFSIEAAPEAPDSPLVQAYSKLRMLMPLLLRYQGQGATWGLLFDEQNKERVIMDGDLAITCSHDFILPWDQHGTDGAPWPEGGGLLLRLAPGEYIVAGSGMVLVFAKQTEKAQDEAEKQLGEDGFALAGTDASTAASTWKGARCGIGSVDEVTVDEAGNLHYVRRMNGDQDHQGRHVSIPGRGFSILHVKLYEYK